MKMFDNFHKMIESTAVTTTTSDRHVGRKDIDQMLS